MYRSAATEPGTTEDRGTPGEGLLQCPARLRPGQAPKQADRFPV